MRNDAGRRRVAELRTAPLGVGREHLENVTRPTLREDRVTFYSYTRGFVTRSEKKVGRVT